MRNKRNLIGLGAALILGTSTPALSAEEETENFSKCGGYVSLAERSKYRFNVGVAPLSNPVTEASLSVNCGNFDIYVWGVHNNDSGNINEVDIGVGYSFSRGEFKGRIGVERYFFEEDEMKGDFFVGDIAYEKLPLDLSGRVVMDLSNKGTLSEFSLSKSFNLRKSKKIPIILTPSVTVGCLDGFFGFKDCPSNIVYKTSLDTNKGNTTFGISGEYHDGKGPFENDTKVSLELGYSF